MKRLVADRTISFPALSRIATSLRGRPDSEHEMSFNRLAFCAIIMTYLFATWSGPINWLLFVTSLYSVVTVALFLHILWRPQRSTRRRYVAVMCDVSALSIQLHLGGHVTSVLFPLYLWIVFGNGFRFGINALRASMLASLIGFAGVIVSTPFWNEQLFLAIGLLIGLLVLPLYSGTLIRKLSQAKQQAEEASRSKSLFLASVSHELRTPLTAIIGMGSLLADTKLDAEQADMARTVQGAAKSLLSLINGILDLSRIDAGHMPTPAVDFNLGELALEIRGMVTAQARAKGLRLGVHITNRTPLLLRGDRRHLHEILLNLAGNAVKFTDSGSVVLAVDATALSSGRVRLRFEVSDTGVGIPAEAKGRIFETFTQADETIIDRFGGTGLGLAICKRLVALLGGEIDVESQVGVGSTFWFTADVDQQIEEVGRQPSSFDGAHIILLSADAAVADRVTALAAPWGVNVQVVSSAARAISLLRSATDGMPRSLLLHREGLNADVGALASALQGLDPTGRLPLILIENAPTVGLPDLSLRRHFVTTIAAPIADEELRRALEIAGLHRAALPLRQLDEPKAARPQRRLNILVADDNRTNQRVLGKILERAGFETRIVGNGEEALDALGETRFDLVLMDVNMPVMNGLEATKLYRFTALGQPHVPIVALTADTTPEAAQRCADAGMDACVTKPVEPAALLEIINSMVPQIALETETQPAPTLVTDIAAHPRFRPAGAPTAVDERILDELEVLGGAEFLAELIKEFVRDAEIIVNSLGDAAEQGDARLFRDRAHALRSGAANIGAKGLYDLCLQWRQISVADLQENGSRHVERMRAELERTRRALLQHRVLINRSEGHH